MRELLLTNEEQYNVWLKSECEDPFQYIAFDEVIARAQILKLADMGLGFYETDPNFPENNRFISLKEVLETE